MTTEVKLSTSLGDVVVELYGDVAPRTVHNFVTLAQYQYYNGTIFHRVIPDFMVQGGDPTGTGRGGESVYGGKFEDEVHPKLKHTGAGVLSMANAGPNSNGSQFFITLAPCPWLDGKHTIFGRVKSGMGVVQKMGRVVTKSDKPVADLVLHSATPHQAT
jgi:peptidyl-prolyl cis-trans isomerase-like 1